MIDLDRLEELARKASFNEFLMERVDPEAILTLTAELKRLREEVAGLRAERDELKFRMDGLEK